MNQDLLVGVLVKKLQQVVLSPDALDRLRAALRRQMESRRADEGAANALRKQVAELDKEIDRAAENFLKAPTEVLDLVGQKLTLLKRQRQHAQDQLKKSEAAAKPIDAETQIDSVVGQLWRLGEELERGEPARRREVFRQFVSRIELRFDRISRGKRVECPLLSGEIHLRTEVGDIFGSVSRGDWHSFEPAREVFEPYLAAAIDGLDAALAMLATQAMRG